jgi:hypothetical protein
MGRVLLEKLRVAEIVKIFSAFYGARKFLNATELLSPILNRFDLVAPAISSARYSLLET